MKTQNGWNVYDKDGKFICSYGFGWSLTEVFESSPRVYLATLTIDGKDRHDNFRDSMKKAVVNQ